MKSAKNNKELYQNLLEFAERLQSLMNEFHESDAQRIYQLVLSDAMNIHLIDKNGNSSWKETRDNFVELPNGYLVAVRRLDFTSSSFQQGAYPLDKE